MVAVGYASRAVLLRSLLTDRKSEIQLAKRRKLTRGGKLAVEVRIRADAAGKPGIAEDVAATLTGRDHGLHLCLRCEVSLAADVRFVQHEQY